MLSADFSVLGATGTCRGTDTPYQMRAVAPSSAQPERMPMNWAMGFTMGLMLGMTIFNGIHVAQRRSQQQTLERLLQSGAYRVLKADGRAVSASELLVALGAVPARRFTGRQLAVMIAVGVVAGFGAAFALLNFAR